VSDCVVRTTCFICGVVYEEGYVERPCPRCGVYGDWAGMMIYHLRRHAGISRKDFARRMCIKPETLKGYEFCGCSKKFFDRSVGYFSELYKDFGVE